MKQKRTELVTVAVFDNPVQANLVKNELEAEGIQARLVDEHVVGMNWMLTNAIGGVKLVVRSNDYRDAAKLLDKWSAEHEGQRGQAHDRREKHLSSEDAEAAENEQHARASKRRSRHSQRDRSSPTEQDAQRALFAAVLGLLFCPLELYASWLLLGVWLSEERLDAAHRRKAWTALTFNVFALLVYLVTAKTMFFSH